VDELLVGKNGKGGARSTAGADLLPLVSYCFNLLRAMATDVSALLRENEERDQRRRLLIVEQLQVSLKLRFKRLFFYTIVVVFYIEWCIRNHLSSPSFYYTLQYI
jgi:hypothetical protein